MDVKGWSKFTFARARAYGTDALPLIGADLLSTVCRGLGVDQRGEFVFENEWDVLVILDACRHDMYEEVVGPCESAFSRASTSEEWMEKNFAKSFSDELAETTYVTANPHSNNLNEDQFEELDEVWRYGWDEKLGTVRAETMTNRAIVEGRHTNTSRLIVHYMQPHYPFIGEGTTYGKMNPDEMGHDGDLGHNVWTEVATGRLARQEVLNAYYENLRYVRDDVRRLIENVDGKMVITADHGNFLGEYGLYGHPGYIPAAVLRKVPWEVIECTDKKTEMPLNPKEETSQSSAVEDRLADLGYLE